MILIAYHIQSTYTMTNTFLAECNDFLSQEMTSYQICSSRPRVAKGAQHYTKLLTVKHS